MAFAFGSTEKLEKELSLHKKKVVDVENRLAVQQAENTKLKEENARLARQFKETRGAASGPATGPAGATPQGPLSRQCSDGSDSSQTEALKSSLAEKEKLIDELSARVEQLQAAASATSATTAAAAAPAAATGFKVVGMGSPSSTDANRAQALRSECDTWKTRSEGLTLELKSVQRKLQAAEGEQSLLADRCSTLEGGKLAAEEQVRGLQSQLTAIRQAGDHTQRELHSKLAQRDTELLRLQGEQGQAMERIDELRAQVDKQAQDKVRLEQGIALLEGEVAKQKQARQEQAGELAQLVRAVEEKAAAAEELAAQLKDAEAAKRAKEAQVEDLLVKLEGGKKDRMALEAEARHRAASSGESAEEGEVLRAQLRGTLERVEAAEVTISASRAQLVDLQKLLEAKERQLLAATEALDGQAAEVAELKKALAQGEEGRLLMQGGVTKLEQQVQELKVELDTKSVFIAELIAQLDATQREAADKGQALAELTGQLQEAHVAVDAMRSRLEGEVEDLRCMNAKLTSPAEHLEGEVEQLKAQLQAAEHAGETGEHLLQAVQARLAVVQRAEADAQVRVSELEAQCEGLRQEVAAKDQHLACAETKLAQVGALLGHKQALQKELQDSETSRRVTATQFGLLTDELEAAQAQLKDRDAALQTARQALAEKDRRVQAQDRDLGTHLASIGLLERRLTDQESHSLDQESGAASKDVTISDLKVELRTKELEAQDASRSLEASRRDVAHLMAQVAELRAKAERSQKRIEALKDDLDQANAGHEADKAVRQLLDEVRLELAAERMAHARTCRMLLETQEQLEEAGREGSVTPGEATGVRRAVLDMESRLAEQDLEACRLEVETSQQEVAASTPEARAEVEVVAEVVAEADMVTPTSEAAAAPPAVAAGVAPAAAEPAEAESAQELQEDTDGPPDVKGTEAASAEEGSDELTEVVGTPAAAAEGGEGAGEASAAEPQAAAPPAKSME